MGNLRTDFKAVVHLVGYQVQYLYIIKCYTGTVIQSYCSVVYVCSNKIIDFFKKNRVQQFFCEGLTLVVCSS